MGAKTGPAIVDAVGGKGRRVERVDGFRSGAAKATWPGQGQGQGPGARAASPPCLRASLPPPPLNAPVLAADIWMKRAAVPEGAMRQGR